jgi:hypothetical protein
LTKTGTPQRSPSSAGLRFESGANPRRGSGR